MLKTKKGEFTTDDPSLAGRGAIKYDGGKPCLYRGVVDYFPRAIEAVGKISTFGANKYAWKGWEDVPEGFARYSDAMVRHLISEAKGEILDPDSGLPHAAHAAWGALARLELFLREQEGVVTEQERLKEDLRLVNNIDFISVDKDNMEFQATVSCFQVDALRRLIERIDDNAN